MVISLLQERDINSSHGLMACLTRAALAESRVSRVLPTEVAARTRLVNPLAAKNASNPRLTKLKLFDGVSILTIGAKPPRELVWCPANKLKKSF